jgi:hypothetical protein
LGLPTTSLEDLGFSKQFAYMSMYARVLDYIQSLPIDAYWPTADPGVVFAGKTLEDLLPPGDTRKFWNLIDIGEAYRAVEEMVEKESAKLHNDSEGNKFCLDPVQARIFWKRKWVRESREQKLAHLHPGYSGRRSAGAKEVALDLLRSGLPVEKDFLKYYHLTLSDLDLPPHQDVRDNGQFISLGES